MTPWKCNYYIAVVSVKPYNQQQISEERQFFVFSIWHLLMFGANQQFKCGFTLYVLLCISTTSTRHHSGQNVVDTEGLFTSERITVRRREGGLPSGIVFPGFVYIRGKVTPGER